MSGDTRGGRGRAGRGGRVRRDRAENISDGGSPDSSDDLI